MKKFLLSCILLFVLSNLFGYNSLRVGDPRTGWSTLQGTIEEASLSVRSKGLFMEYGLYLTFSSRGTNWTKVTDTLEVVLQFDLPEDAIVHDSWLWIGDDIVRAKILDKWSASAIYEGIVKRRRDPSILSKQSATQYELRVFPMAGNETRKVKITYLVPITWDKSHVTAPIPLSIVNTSRYKPDYFQIFTWCDAEWVNPFIENEADLTFRDDTDPVFNDFKRVDIPSSKFGNALKIGFDSPVKNGLYFSKYQTGSEGLYQFALFPSEFLDVAASKKVAILIDYDISNTTISTAELLNLTKNEMLKNLSPQDSFNLIFSNLTISRYSNKWVSASPLDIETAFSTLTNPLTNYSNLPSLLSNGIDFVKSNGNDGKIILVSNSDQYAEYQTANTLINDIMGLMDPKIQIHIADYQSTSFPSHYINGYNYYGNEYFYANLSKLSLGSFHRVRTGYTVSETINQSFKYLSGSINSFDLHTKVTSGFCYSRYTIQGAGPIAYVNDPVLQVGKFKGDFPFTIEISGEYNNQIFANEIEIVNGDAIVNDSITEEIWTGQYINELESGQQTNDIINEIIYQSLNERVLSRYTSFLCLEDTNLICKDCLDESKLVAVEEAKAVSDSLVVYPNPFVRNLTVEFYCSNPGEFKELAVYSYSGNLLHLFDVPQVAEGKNTLTWDGKTTNGTQVKQGVYLLIYKTSKATKTVKLIKR